MKRIKILLLMLSYIVTAGVSAQDVSDLRGVVYGTSAGDPVPGASILIIETEQGTSADADGRFEFKNLRAGNYSIRIQAIGFVATELQISHPDDGFVRVELERDVIRSEDVIVTSSPLGRSIQYQPAEALNTEMLQQKAAPSLGEILDGMPGVTTRSYGSAPARPVIRGFDGDRVLVMQNGERMGDLSGTAVDHAVGLDPLAMERVEVVRGPASLLYGSSAIGGVVNMFSNDMPRDWDSGTSATLATHGATTNNMGAGLVRAQYGNEKFAVTGRMIYRNGGDLQTPEGRLPDTAIDNLSYGGGIGYRVGSFETGLSISGMDYVYGLPEAIDNMNESIEIRMDRVNLQSISTLKLDGFFDHAELRIHYSDYYHDEVAIERFEDQTVMEGVDISFDQQTISSSLILRHRQLGNMEGAAGLSFNSSSISVGGGDALTPDAGGYFLAGYIYEEIGISDFLTVKTGARVEWKETTVRTNDIFTDASIFEDRSDLIFSGALGLNFSPSSEWTAGIQLARAYRTPSIEELYSFAPHAAAGSFDIGDPSLENEYSIGADAFIKYGSSVFSGEVSVYANRIDNFVDFAPTGETDQPSGLPVYTYGSKDALLYGFELSTDVHLSKQITAGAVFDYVRGVERTGEKHNLTFMPPFRTHVELRYDNGTLWAGPRIRIVNRQDKVAPNEDSTPGYLLAGADAGYRFSQGVTLSFRLDNLLNERYRDHLSRVENRNAPMPGRSLNVMMRWEF